MQSRWCVEQVSWMCSPKLHLRFGPSRHWSIPPTRRTTQKAKSEAPCNDCKATSRSRQATTSNTTIGVCRKWTTNNGECWVAKHRRVESRGTRPFVIKAHHRCFIKTNDFVKCVRWLISYVLWLSWNLLNSFEQFVRCFLDSHVFFVVGYPFHFTRYCWPFCRNIRSTSYSWSFCFWYRNVVWTSVFECVGSKSDTWNTSHILASTRRSNS